MVENLRVECLRFHWGPELDVLPDESFVSLQSHW